VHKHPLYYAVRNHIIDFLVARSKSFAKEMRGKYDPRQVPTVRPAGVESVLAADNERNVLRMAGHH
jgi:nitrate/nitrite transport system ATP-binding protein